MLLLVPRTNDKVHSAEAQNRRFHDVIFSTMMRAPPKAVAAAVLGNSYVVACIIHDVYYTMSLIDGAVIIDYLVFRRCLLLFVNCAILPSY